jgi:hypothetical protein
MAHLKVSHTCAISSYCDRNQQSWRMRIPLSYHLFHLSRVPTVCFHAKCAFLIKMASSISEHVAVELIRAAFRRATVCVSTCEFLRSCKKRLRDEISQSSKQGLETASRVLSGKGKNFSLHCLPSFFINSHRELCPSR